MAVAQVYAEIEAEDGSRIGHRYRVEIERGEAVIKEAMTATDAWGALEYLDMNGVRIDIDPEAGLVSILLLPGRYEFYPDLPSTMDLEGGDAMLVLGDRYLTLGSDTADEWLPAPWLLMSAEGEDAVNAALRAHFDACAADPSGDGCALAFPIDAERDLAVAPGAAWEITAYPEVRAERLWFEHGTGFGAAVGRAGRGAGAGGDHRGRRIAHGAGELPDLGGRPLRDPRRRGRRGDQPRPRPGSRTLPFGDRGRVSGRGASRCG